MPLSPPSCVRAPRPVSTLPDPLNVVCALLVTERVDPSCSVPGPVRVRLFSPLIWAGPSTEKTLFRENEPFDWSAPPTRCSRPVPRALLLPTVKKPEFKTIGPERLLLSTPETVTLPVEPALTMSEPLPPRLPARLTLPRELETVIELKELMVPRPRMLRLLRASLLLKTTEPLTVYVLVSVAAPSAWSVLPLFKSTLPSPNALLPLTTRRLELTVVWPV